MKNKKKAIFPGSFSPFTNGHLSIVKRAIPLFDEIIIAIGVNSKKNNLFSVEKRTQWITNIFKNEPKVKIQKYEGLTVNFCHKMNARYILRGLRDSHDFKYEKGIAQMNQAINKNIETIFIITDPESSHISSTLIRDIIKNGGDVSQFIPKEIKI